MRSRCELEKLRLNFLRCASRGVVSLTRSIQLSRLLYIQDLEKQDICYFTENYLALSNRNCGATWDAGLKLPVINQKSKLKPHKLQSSNDQIPSLRDWSKSAGGRGEGWAGAFQNVVVRKQMTHPFLLAQN